MTSKSTLAEVEKRINKVFDLLVNGATREQIFQYASEKAQWGVTQRQLDNYIAKANERISSIGKIHRELELGRAIARLHHLYFLSITLQNFSVALGVQKELNKLLSLNPPSQYQLQGSEGELLKLDSTILASEILRQAKQEKSIDEET